MADEGKLVMTIIKHDKLLIVLFFIAFLHGSAFFLFNTVLRPSFVLGPFLIVALPVIALPHYRDRTHLRLLLLSMAFVAVAGCYLVLAHEQVQLLDFFYLAALPCTLVTAQSAAERAKVHGGGSMLRVICWGTAVIIAALLYEVVSGVQVVTKDLNYVYSSIFNNPNDLATVVVCFMPLVAYLLRSAGARPTAYAIFYAVTAGLVVITLSRAALMLFLIFLFLHILSLIVRRGVLLSLLALVFAIVVGYLLVTTDLERALLALAAHHNQTIAENAKRLWLFAYSLGEDKSVGGRLEVYQYFFRHFFEALSGFGIKNYSEFFSGSRVMKLAEVNPHSFFIEVVLAFGVCGLVYLLVIVSVVMRAFWRSRLTDPDAARTLLTTALFFFAASNIPSSIFRLPVIWFPMFFMFFLVQGGVNRAGQDEQVQS